jgi:hypothetical protein
MQSGRAVLRIKWFDFVTEISRGLGQDRLRADWILCLNDSLLKYTNGSKFILMRITTTCNKT